MYIIQLFLFICLLLISKIQIQKFYKYYDNTARLEVKVKKIIST